MAATLPQSSKYGEIAFPHTSWRTRLWRSTPMALAYIAILVMLIYAVFPFFWMISTSLRTRAEIRTTNPSLLPASLDWDNYHKVIFESSFLTYVRNSLIVSGTVTITTIVIATLAGYSLSRFGTRRGVSAAGVGLLAGQLVPSVLLIIPLYLTMQSLGLLNSYWSLIITYTTFTVPLATLMLRGFFDQVSIEIEEAAEVDGCPAWLVVWRIVLPLATSGIMTTALYAFVTAWNEFLFAYTFITDDDRYTLTPGISVFMGIWTIDYGALMAAAVLGVLPVTLAYLYLQRYLVAGISAGATKG